MLGPIALWRTWSTLLILPGLSYDTCCVFQIWCLLTSIFLGWLCHHNTCETVGYLHWCGLHGSVLFQMDFSESSWSCAEVHCIALFQVEEDKHVCTRGHGAIKFLKKLKLLLSQTQLNVSPADINVRKTASVRSRGTAKSWADLSSNSSRIPIYSGFPFKQAFPVMDWSS